MGCRGATTTLAVQFSSLIILSDQVLLGWAIQFSVTLFSVSNSVQSSGLVYPHSTQVQYLPRRACFSHSVSVTLFSHHFNHPNPISPSHPSIHSPNRSTHPIQSHNPHTLPQPHLYPPTVTNNLQIPSQVRRIQETVASLAKRQQISPCSLSMARWYRAQRHTGM